MARIEASASHADDMLRRGIDIRYVVTSLQGSDAEHLYETIYCARGQAENLIKQHSGTARLPRRRPLVREIRGSFRTTTRAERLIGGPSLADPRACLAL